MGGEDSDPDHQIAEGYLSSAEVIEAPKSKRGKLISAALQVLAIVGKVKEVALLGPAALIVDALWSAFKPKKKSKRSATAKKMFGDE